MKKLTLAQQIRFNVCNFLARKKNNKTPFSYSADDLLRQIKEGIKEYIDAEIKSTKFQKKSVYEISYLDVSHNQFKVRMFDDLTIAVEWMRYMENVEYKHSWFKHLHCNFQDEYDACNEVPF